MSFGRPGGFGDAFKVSPPARGSFPLDHDGECKDAMMAHLKCLKANYGDAGKCRLESRRYLECRMDKGLMVRDDMANLGLGDVGTDKPVRYQTPQEVQPQQPATATTTATTGSPGATASQERI
ncbi:cytochrome c oxidase assembly protein COX19 [Papiliotrema laurentii]|uniref:Cytochrome c oxidase assembly protein COX19 n=1 Tax=Papiliotrema laurentii TaxID=5418 RepID=A0AAD9FQ47_PAPLA|nr:cytochrome c oxidase assembly protein COX19 [Papiliotrema laurentii]